MRNPIKTSPQFKAIGSFDAIARRLIEKYKDTFAGIPPRNLGNYIGALDKGNGTWWEGRDEMVECLAELLEIDSEEISVQKNIGRHMFAFPGFKDCPPLDLIREEVWEIAEPRLVSGIQNQDSRYYSKPTLDVWQFAESAFLRNGDIEWLHVPDDVEYQLLTRKLAAVSRHGLVERRSLQEVLEHDHLTVCQQLTLIVAVENGARREDLRILSHHRHRAPTLIISPYPPPAPAPQLQTDASRDSDSNDLVKINRWTWTLRPNWREILLKWMGRRIETQLHDKRVYSPKFALDVLESVDPSGQWFASVDDLLTLCQAVSESGKNKLLEAGSDGKNENLSSLLLSPDDSVRDWVSYLVKARWDRWDLPWAGELSSDHWIDLSKGLCSLETLTRRKVIVRGKEGYDFRQPILSRLLLRHELMTRLVKDKPASWAPACFDNERRPLLDAALDALAVHELSVVATNLHRAESAETIGAREALFVAMGRRLIRCEVESKSIPPNLIELAGRAVNGMRLINGFLTPRSRPLDTQDRQLEWFAVCWAWSLAPKPKMDIPPEHWMFPGWAKSLPPKMPDWLSCCGNPNYGYPWERFSRKMDDFLRIVMRWLGRDNAVTVAFQSIVFNIALLARLPSDKQAVNKYWWAGILGTPAAEQALLDLVESDNNADKSKTAFAWWPSLIETRREEYGRNSINLGDPPSSLCGYRGSPVIDWVLKYMAKDPAGAIDALDENGIILLARRNEDLPVALKKELLSRFQDPEGSLHELLEAKDSPNGTVCLPAVVLDFSKFGVEPQIADEVRKYLRYPGALGRQAAQYLWNWAPGLAESLLTQRPAPDKKSSRNLILCAPDSVISKVIGLLMEDRELMADDERRGWVYARLPNARQHAEAMMELI